MPALLVGDYRGDIVLLDVWGVKADITLATDVPVEVGLSIQSLNSPDRIGVIHLPEVTLGCRIVFIFSWFSHHRPGGNRENEGNAVVFTDSLSPYVAD